MSPFARKTAKEAIEFSNDRIRSENCGIADRRVKVAHCVLQIARKSGQGGDFPGCDNEEAKCRDRRIAVLRRFEQVEKMRMQLRKEREEQRRE